MRTVLSFFKFVHKISCQKRLIIIPIWRLCMGWTTRNGTKTKKRRQIGGKDRNIKERPAIIMKMCSGNQSSRHPVQYTNFYTWGAQTHLPYRTVHATYLYITITLLCIYEFPCWNRNLTGMLAMPLHVSMVYSHFTEYYCSNRFQFRMPGIKNFRESLACRVQYTTTKQALRSCETAVNSWQNQCIWTVENTYKINPPYAVGMTQSV
jgi:hypothetical protein